MSIQYGVILLIMIVIFVLRIAFSNVPFMCKNNSVVNNLLLSEKA